MSRWHPNDVPSDSWWGHVASCFTAMPVDAFPPLENICPAGDQKPPFVDSLPALKLSGNSLSLSLFTLPYTFSQKSKREVTLVPRCEGNEPSPSGPNASEKKNPNEEEILFGHFQKVFSRDTSLYSRLLDKILILFPFFFVSFFLLLS